MGTNGKTRIFGLDLMRAVAILGVLGSHILWIFPDASGSVVSLLRMGGVMGVELFFVLSGFLIGRILFKLYCSPDFKLSEFKYFLVRRWFRTLPNYYLVLLLNIVLVAAIGRALPESLPLYFGFLQNFVSGMDIFFTESWSLPVEEVAYVIGPLLLYVGIIAFAKAKKETLFLGTTLLIIIMCIGTKIQYNYKLSDTSLEYWNINLKAVVLYRIDAIYYGVLAAYVSLRYETFWRRHKDITMGLGIFVFIGFQLFLGYFQLDTTRAPFVWNVLYLPLVSIAFCFLLPLLSTWEKGPKLIRQPIRTISVTSYAIYLLHYGLILQTMRWIWPIEDFSSMERIIFAGLYLVLTFALSYAWYRVYEKPMMNLRDHPRVKGYFKN